MTSGSDGAPARKTPANPGSPLTSWHVLSLAVPVMISNATTPLVGLVDTAVIGQLGASELIGGVAVAVTIFSLLYSACFFLQIGTIGFTAQAVGADDRGEIAANLFRPLVIAVLLGVVILALRGPIARATVAMIGGSDAVQSAAITYVEVRALSAPAALASLAVLGWLIGLGQTHVVFWLQLLLNIVNAVLAVWFVAGLGWGVPGVAAATAIADWMAAAAGLVYAGRTLAARGWSASLASVLAPDRLRRALSINRDLTIRTLCISGVFAFFVAQGAKAGDVTLAANAVLFQLTFVTVFLIDGFETAAQTLVGQAIGARDEARYRQAVWLSFIWAAAVGCALALGLWMAGPWLIAALAANAEVRATASHYLIWAALVPVVGLWAFILDGIFVGATRGADLRNMMLISTAVYAVAWAGLTAVAGNHGLWAALLVFFMARALALWVRMPALSREMFGDTAPVAAARPTIPDHVSG